MIRRIIHIADMHIPNQDDGRHYNERLKALVVTVAERVAQYDRDEVRIVIVGDIYESKVRTSNEAVDTFHAFLNYMNKIAKTYVIAGNHDLNKSNLERMDSITPTFAVDGGYPDVCYLDRHLDYKSGIIRDENVFFVLFSIFDLFRRPDGVGKIKTEEYDRVIGLYHGDVVGSTTDAGWTSESGTSMDTFEGCDVVMAGHIHKFQEIRRSGVRLVYSGSVFQKEMGENILGHGFVEWDLETMEYEHVPVDVPYRIVKIGAKDYDAFEKDTEEIINI